MIVVLQNFPQDVVEDAMDSLVEVCKYGYPDYRISAGISVNDSGIHSLPRNFKRAIALLRIAERQDQAKLSYRN